MIPSTINKDAVKEILKRDGYDAALDYLTQTEELTQEDAQSYLKLISGFEVHYSNVDEAVEKFAQTAQNYYCERDNFEFVSIRDECPECGGHVMKDECLIDTSSTNSEPLHDHLNIHCFWDALKNIFK